MTTNKPYVGPHSLIASCQYDDMTGTVAADGFSLLAHDIAEYIGVDTESWWPIHVHIGLSKIGGPGNDDLAFVSVFAVAKSSGEANWDDVVRNLEVAPTPEVVEFSATVKDLAQLLRKFKRLSIELTRKDLNLTEVEVSQKHELPDVD